MWLLLLQVFCSGLSLATLLVLLWASREYVRGKRQIRNLLCKFWESLRPPDNRMQMDDMIDELLAEETPAAPCKPAAKQPENADLVISTMREKLAIAAAGGQTKQYLGKDWSVEEIESLGVDEVKKLYARYEARLGAAMTKTMGRFAIELYVSVASIFLPIPPENIGALIGDLESDPFISHALNSTACNMYYQFGSYLAPFTAVLNTVKHCRFGHQCPIVNADDDGEQPGDGSSRCGETSPGDSC